jgi:Ca2+-binding EF-hand superfamily protein
MNSALQTLFWLSSLIRHLTQNHAMTNLSSIKRVPADIANGIIENINKYDLNKDGILSFSEFKQIMSDTGTSYTDEQILQTMKKFDIDNNGEVTVAEAIEVSAQQWLEANE